MKGYFKHENNPLPVRGHLLLLTTQTAGESNDRRTESYCETDKERDWQSLPERHVLYFPFFLVKATYCKSQKGTLSINGMLSKGEEKT